MRKTYEESLVDFTRNIFFSFGIVAISFEAGEEDAYSDQATLKTLGIVSYESTRLYRPI